MGIESSNRHLATAREGMCEMASELESAKVALEAAAQKVVAAYTDIGEETSELLRAALVEDLPKGLLRAQNQVMPDYQAGVEHINNSGIEDMERTEAALAIFGAREDYESAGEEYTRTWKQLVPILDTLPKKLETAEVAIAIARDATLGLVAMADASETYPGDIHDVVAQTATAQEKLTEYMG